ncbi:uroporphyrinogen decarboxylase family protein [Nocardioides convexus]|uniref:uroporphyrinogen decarboxylase family protein n=1 Tax=Nocardioides convexus TaxID=2712224 RepID=UPI00241883C1|nr:uroporphyrinogen decarboxylase family protein [Nocardioides convexus]
MGEAGADVVGVDWRTPLDRAIPVVGDRAVQGNLDPTLVFAPTEVMTARAAEVIEAGRAARGHVFNLGHGVIPSTDPDQARAADGVRADLPAGLSRGLHREPTAARQGGPTDGSDTGAMDEKNPTPETEPLRAGASGNRWEQPEDTAAETPAPPAAPADVPPPPETGAYPVLAAPVAKRRRARAAAAVAAAAVVAGVAGAGGFAIGHVTAGDDAQSTGQDAGQDGGRFGDHRFGDGDRPAPPGGQQGGVLPGQQQDQQQDQQAPDQGSGAATS